MIYYSNSEKETFNIGKKIAKEILPGDIFLVSGTLGAGKSVFIRGAAHALGVRENMPSPTFTLVNEYQINTATLLYHFDFYRLDDPIELYEVGFEDYIYSRGISFIEWPEKGGSLLPEDAVMVNIKIKADQREIEIKWNR